MLARYKAVNLQSRCACQTTPASLSLFDKLILSLCNVDLVLPGVQSVLG